MFANFTSTMFAAGRLHRSRLHGSRKLRRRSPHDSRLAVRIHFTCDLRSVLRPDRRSPVLLCLQVSQAKGRKGGEQRSHNTPLELAWSILPSFFLVGMFVFGAKAYLDHRTVPDGANELGVQAFKWGWTFDYGGGTFNPRTAPAGRRTDEVVDAIE